MLPTPLKAVPDTARLASAAALQRVLVDLMVLSLDAKQAHWNVTGEAFLPIHTLTDEVAVDARAWADRVAERAVALGFTVDARAGRLAAAAGDFPAGRLHDREAITELAASLDHVIATCRDALDELVASDVVSHDIVVMVLEGLEKYRWMLLAQAS
jgi:starvation-inducible DNA-binding protein